MAEACHTAVLPPGGRAAHFLGWGRAGLRGDLPSGMRTLITHMENATMKMVGNWKNKKSHYYNLLLRWWGRCAVFAMISTMLRKGEGWGGCCKVHICTKFLFSVIVSSAYYAVLKVVEWACMIRLAWGMPIFVQCPDLQNLKCKILKTFLIQISNLSWAYMNILHSQDKVIWLTDLFEYKHLVWDLFFYG